MQPPDHIYEPRQLEVFAAHQGLSHVEIKRFKNLLFKKSASSDEALALWPQPAATLLREQTTFEVLSLHEAHASADGSAEKLIFKTHDDHLIETVILKPASGRTTVCISSQIGCACYCSFCATGLMGFTRNLSSAEILDQVRQVNQRIEPEGRRVRNVVFMGMGEPLLNTDAVFQAVEQLIDPACFNLSGAHITLSTVGIVPGMVAFVERFSSCRLALSLHSARQEMRQRLMPQAAMYDLTTLKQVLVECASKGTVMIEYLMLAGVTDQPEDLEALVAFVEDIPIHINLIPFNSFAGSNLVGSEKSVIDAFAQQLKSSGFKVTTRRSLGGDIDAACGQLVQHKLRS